MTLYIIATIYLTVSGNTHDISNCAVEGIIRNVKMQKRTYLKLKQHFLILQKTHYINSYILIDNESFCRRSVLQIYFS